MLIFDSIFSEDISKNEIKILRKPYEPVNLDEALELTSICLIH